MFGKSEKTGKVQRFVGHSSLGRAKYGSHYETGAHKKGKETEVTGTENIFYWSDCTHTT
jgi:hypothetical protein